ncbi:MAG: zinc ribbon domain-containing protein, partial [Candidatus Hodarchaeota archaeon]
MSKYCPYCGNPVKETDKFCIICGKPLLADIPKSVKRTEIKETARRDDTIKFEEKPEEVDLEQEEKNQEIIVEKETK